MKRTVIKVLLILLTGILILDCKKQNNAIPVGMSAVVDNKFQWLASRYGAQIDTVTDSADTIVFLDISGYDTSFSGAGQGGLDIVIPNYKNKTGVYELSTNPTGSFVYYSNFTGRTYGSTSGAIKLTKITTDNVQGTFNCLVGVGEQPITNGQFNVPIK